MGSARLRVKVVPGARNEQVVGRYGDAIRVRVSAPPEAGRANEAVIRLLAAELGIAPQRISLLRGHSSPIKTFQISGLSQQQLDALLARWA